LADTLAMTNTHSTNGHRALLAVMTVFLLLLVGVTSPRMAHAAPPPNKPYVTGNFAAGAVGEDFLHFGDGTGYRRPDTTILVLDLTLNNLPGRASLTTSFRQPLFGSSFWNDNAQLFTAEVRLPVGRGHAFASYERLPATGFEFAWFGYRLPFRL
jgi:hypothetical protein